MGAAPVQAGWWTVMIKLRLSWLAAGALIVAAFLPIQPAAAQSMMNGWWNPLGHKDSDNYGGGPEPGDFSGLPITDAARKIALQYDADEFEMPELMCRPFMATYAPRTLSTMRVWDTT